jgi:uncharacterized protein (TIGR00369 family)
VTAYTDDELETIAASFEAIPLHRHFGLQFGHASGGPVCSFEVTPELTGGFDYLHGGVLYAVLDVASAYALTRSLPRGVQEKTVDLSITMVRSAKLGDVVELFVDVDHVGRKNAFLTSRACRAADGKLLSRAHVTKAFVELDKLAAASALARGERVET